ncbi:MAG: hypothetical protein K8I30_20365 [Anaerolineae bacterium]|nr:hypothetical protein [Anaerolineae bacterium]
MDARIKEIDDLMERLTAIQEEIDKRAKAKRVTWYQQPGFPYWTNRLARVELIHDFGDGFWQAQVNIEMRYAAGAYTEGIDADLEIGIQRFILYALAVFQSREGLESKKFPDEMDALEIGHSRVSSRGVGTIPTGERTSAKGTTFDLQANLTITVGGL